MASGSGALHQQFSETPSHTCYDVWMKSLSQGGVQSGTRLQLRSTLDPPLIYFYWYCFLHQIIMTPASKDIQDFLENQGHHHMHCILHSPAQYKDRAINKWLSNFKQVPDPCLLASLRFCLKLLHSDTDTIRARFGRTWTSWCSPLWSSTNNSDSWPKSLDGKLETG